MRGGALPRKSVLLESRGNGRRAHSLRLVAMERERCFMSAEASWITLAIWIAGAVFVLGLAAAGLAAKGVRRVWLSVECPATSHPATVVTLQNKMSGRCTDVVNCSELDGDVTCARTCLAQVNDPSRTS